MSGAVATLCELDDARWRAARERVAAAGPHLGAGWIAYRRAQGLAARGIVVRDAAGRDAACGVAWLARPRWRPWARAHVRLDRLPWALEGATLDADATAAATLAALQAARCGAIELESFDGPWPAPDLARLGLVARERLEFLLDLRGTEEERFARIKSSHRRKVRDAGKAGVTVADESARGELELLHELQGHTQERRAARGDSMSVPEREQYRRLADPFVRSGGGRFFVGRRDGAALSAILCGVEGTRAYYLMGGTSPAGFECNAATFVLWRAALLLAEAGVTELNLGGVPRDAEREGHPEHGLWRFKEGFAPRREECRSATWVRGER